MTGIITSTSNPRIRNLLQLQSKSKERRKQNLMLIEGFREISRALAAGVVVTELYYCKEADQQGFFRDFGSKLNKTDIFEISKAVFEKIAYREGSDGMMALAVPPEERLNTLKLSVNPLIIILESVEKPGNLGAVMRTADAAGVDAVIISDPLTDIYNPNTIRSSVGCIFTTPVVAAGSEEVMKWLTQQGIKTYAAALTASARNVYQFDFRGPTAFVMGTEATGLSKSWLDFSTSQVIIPMNGIADSLNVSVSTAIVVYEAYRQRMK
ncbi:MAG: RNA methyltransferase [Bacteroidales bacterium]|nr:RNA methyltransferase [Bacteroidales bacterium]